MIEYSGFKFYIFYNFEISNFEISLVIEVVTFRENKRFIQVTSLQVSVRYCTIGLCELLPHTHLNNLFEMDC